MVVQICKTAARQRDVRQYPEYGPAAIVPISVVVVCFAEILWQPCNKVHGHSMVIEQQSYGIARQICRCKLLRKNIMRALQQPWVPSSRFLFFKNSRNPTKKMNSLNVETAL